MFKIIFIITFLFAGAFTVSAQEAPQCPVMPAGLLCITVDAGRAALEAGDRAKALEAENTELKSKVIPSIKDALEHMRIEFARMSGENTALKTSAVRDAAIMDILIKHSRKKSIGLIAF